MSIFGGAGVYKTKLEALRAHFRKFRFLRPIFLIEKSIHAAFSTFHNSSLDLRGQSIFTWQLYKYL